MIPMKKIVEMPVKKERSFVKPSINGWAIVGEGVWIGSIELNW